MATINIKTNVTAPAEVNIPLVRADYHATSNTFRVFFEVFLSLTSATVGSILSSTSVSTAQWMMLLVFAASAVAFVGCSAYFGRQSKKF